MLVTSGHQGEWNEKEKVPLGEPVILKAKSKTKPNKNHSSADIQDVKENKQEALEQT